MAVSTQTVTTTNNTTGGSIPDTWYGTGVVTWPANGGIVWQSQVHMIPEIATKLTNHLEHYLARQIELYKDRFEQEPSDAMLGIFVQRFMDENYSSKDALDGT